MNNLLNSNKKFVFLSLFLVIAIVLIAFFAFRNTKLSAYYTESGAFEADLVREDSTMFFMFSDEDSSERENLQNIWSKLPKSDNYSDFNTFIDEYLKQYNISYLIDIKPMLPDYNRISVSISKNIQDNEIYDLLATINIKNIDAANTFLQDLSKKDSFFSEEYEGNMIVGNSNAGAYFATYKDFLLLANNRDALRGIFDNLDGTGISNALSGNKLFKENFLNLYPDSFLFGYVNPSDELSKVPLQNLKNLSSTELNEFFALSARDDGLKLNAYVNQKRDEDNQEDISFENGTYLAEEVPSEGVIFYLESRNFINMLKMNGQLEGDSFNRLSTTIKSYVGMDLETDILAFLDKSIAFAVNYQDNNLIPAIRMLADVSSNEGKAEQFVDKIDSQIQGLTSLVNMQYPQFATALIKDTKEVNGENLNHIKLDLKSLPQELFDAFADLPEQLQDNEININYGIYDDLITLSNADDIEIENSLSDNEIFDDMLAEISGYENGIMFISPTNFVNLLDKLIEFNNKINGPLAPDEQMGYDIIKRYADVFDGVILGNKVISPEEMEVQGFVKISE